MGNLFSSLSPMVREEQKSWKLPHELIRNQEDVKIQIPLLSNFGPTLSLCYQDHSKYGITYQHWFITDGTWTIEFIRDKKARARGQLLVHNYPKDPYIETEEFQNTNDVRIRMAKVCGATNYSLGLRNCEHLARYIFCGVWASFQMTGEGVLRKVLYDYMEESKKLTNTFPRELVPEEHSIVELYSGISDLVRFTTRRETLTKDEDNMYNILFLGPTGCGKSTLINQMYNKTVCKVEGGIDSVTKEIHYTQGVYSWPYRLDDYHGVITNRTARVNIIDTIGFCDSVLTPNQVLAIVKNSVRVNLANIDKVVICCSGRMEAEHRNSIKQFMDWLNYKKYKQQFVFFYTKTDRMSEEEKQRNLFRICESLELDNNSALMMKTLIDDQEIKTIQIKLVNAIGFDPNAPLDDILSNRDKLMEAVLAPDLDGNGRIHVSERSCTIL